MRPAHQHLGAGAAPVVRADLRLVVEAEFAAVERAPQLALDAQAVPRLGVELLGVELEAGTALLGDVAGGHAAVAEQRACLHVVVGEDRDADRRADRELLPGGAERRGHRGEETLRDRRRLFAARDAGEEERELVVADAVDRRHAASLAALFRAHARAQAEVEPHRDALQERVADAEPERLDDLLEPLEVHVHDGASGAGARGLAQRPLQAVHQQAAVGQRGHAVVVGEAVAVGFRRERVPEPQRELARVGRLGEEVGRAELERLELGLGVGRGGEDDHRDVAHRLVGAHALDDLEPAHLRHVEVEQDDVRVALADQPEHLQRLAASDELAVTGLLEEGLQHLEVERLVVHHHHDGVVGPLGLPPGFAAGLGRQAGDFERAACRHRQQARGAVKCQDRRHKLSNLKRFPYHRASKLRIRAESALPLLCTMPHFTPPAHRRRPGRPAAPRGRAARRAPLWCPGRRPPSTGFRGCARAP